MIELHIMDRVYHSMTVHQALQDWLSTTHPGTFPNVDLTESEREIVGEVRSNVLGLYVVSSFWHSRFVEDCLINGWKYIHVFNAEKRRIARNRNKRRFAIINREEAMMLRLSDEEVMIPCQIPKWREARDIIERVKKELWAIHGK